MTWVLVYLGIAFAGLVMVGCFALWLWRKAVALLRELGILLERTDQLAGIIEEIGQLAEFDRPLAGHDRRGPHSLGEDDDPDSDSVEIGSTRRRAT